VAVGAHQAHLADGPVRKAMACSECHTVPSDLSHIDGTVELVWGSLATSGGAKPAFTLANATCSATYCHGATLAQGGGKVTAPIWTRVDGTQAACGTCHGDPPPSPHPQNPLCNRCHPQTVAIDGTIDVASGFHVNGILDVAGVGCSSCHGSSANPAPPVGTRGETATSAIAVGAHQAHLSDGPLRKAVNCEECHVVPSDLAHVDGVVELVWGPLATAGGAKPAFSLPNATCASTYCHGATLTAGGTLTAPVWTRVDGTQAACGTCHGAPPPSPHPADARCSLCHPKTVLPDGTIDVAGGYHINGVIDASGECGACHAVPPATGAHLVHAAFTQSPPVATYGDLRVLEDYSPTGGPAYEFGCGNCHPLDAARHMNGKVDVELAPSGAAAASLKARNAAGAGYDQASGQCSGVYCHSSGQAQPAYVATPGWRSGAALGCDGCHGNPPAYPSGGAGALDANGHIALADNGREFGHYTGLAGPSHAPKHGGGIARPTDGAAPITCQTCHFDTTDPINTGPSGFYYLDTSGRYVLPGGDAQRFSDPRWLATQCSGCHTGAPGGAPVGAGKVLPLRHVNGRRDVVFDTRTVLPLYPGLPASPDTPRFPYWVTHAQTCDLLPPSGAVDGTTLSVQLSGAEYDPLTKGCASVACHLGDTPVWGRQYVTATTAASGASCCRCHNSHRCTP
jgi:predicted CxxxxCH...CXXCH cytochrome family protein